MSKLTHQIQEALLQNRPILHEKETWYTTKELQWEMTKVQDYLITAGVSKGDRVLVGLPNSYQFISIFLGIINYGAVVVPMNPNMPEIEFLSFIERSKPVFGFIKPEYTNFLLKEEVKRIPLDSFCRVDYDGYTFFDFKELNKPFQREANIEEDSIAILLYTSGTTGIPKAVGLTHEQILETATNIIMSHELKSMDTTYCFLPLFHINAQVVAVLSTILSHGKIVLDEKFSATKFWKVLSELQITWVSAVPAVISILLEKSQPSEIPTHVRFIRSASAQLPMIHAKRFEQRFGIPLIQSYGMTEAASQICVNPLPPKKRVLGSVGRPVGLQLQIVDSNGRKVPTNKVGEITIRGKNVITSYVEALNQNDFRNGWFHTGDLGFMDQEGFVFIVGRIKEMINRGGEKISPYEVEDVIRQLPMIKEAAVIGIPHHLYGEEIVAYIRQKQHDHNDELEQLVIDHCERNLTSFKCPAKVVIVEDLPHGPTGKVQRSRLKEISLEYFQNRQHSSMR